MKKIISLLLLLTLMCTSISAFAATKADFENAMFETKTQKGEIELSMYAENETIPEIFDTEIASIVKTKINASGNIDASENYEAIKMYLDMTYDFPAELSEMVGQQNISQKAWYDFSADNMLMIMKLNDSSYQYIDYNDIPEYKTAMASMLNAESMDKLNEAMKKIYSGKIDFDIKGDAAKITVSEKSLKETSSGMIELLAPYFSSMMTATAGAEFDFDAAAKKVLAVWDKVPVFAEDAIVMDVELDKNKLITKQNIALNIDVNVFDLMTAIAADFEGVTVPENYTKENSQLKLTYKIDCSMINGGEDFTIEFPEYTKDNSVNLKNAIVPPTDGAVKVLVFDNEVEFDVAPVISESELYIPLRATLNAMGVKDEAISYENGIVASGIGSNIVICTIDSNIISINEQTAELASPIIEVDDRTLVPIDFFSNLYVADNTTFAPSVICQNPALGANIIFAK